VTESIKKRAIFDFIRYANCWEDADILLQSLNIKKNGIYLSIASAGDNSFSLLSKNPKKIIAFDISFVQICLMKLKKLIIEKLEYKEVLSFLGILDCKNRIEIYNKIKRYLHIKIRKYWDNNLTLIKKGVIHTGKFEKYFQIYRKYILPFFVSKKNINRLMTKKSKSERIIFYENLPRKNIAKLFLKIFFSRKVMGLLGRDKEFFKYVEGNVAEKILKRAEYALTELDTHNNPYLEYIIKGNFIKTLPHYLIEKNFKIIKKNIKKIEIIQGDFKTVVKKNKNLKYDGFNLSDIFEYMSEDEFQKQYKYLLKYAKKKSVLVYWNMLVTRIGFNFFSSKVIQNTKLSKKLFKKDKAFFYKNFIIENVK